MVSGLGLLWCFLQQCLENRTFMQVLTCSSYVTLRPRDKATLAWWLNWQRESNPLWAHTSDHTGHSEGRAGWLWPNVPCHVWMGLQIKQTVFSFRDVNKYWNGGECCGTIYRPQTHLWTQNILSLEAAYRLTMDHELRMGLSVWAIAAIVCNTAVGVLVLILFVILYKACKVPSQQEKVPVFILEPEQKKPEHKYLLTAAWSWLGIEHLKWRQHSALLICRTSKVEILRATTPAKMSSVMLWSASDCYSFFNGSFYACPPSFMKIYLVVFVWSC